MLVQSLQAETKSRRNVATHIVALRRYEVVCDGRPCINDEDWPTTSSLVPASHCGGKAIRPQRVRCCVKVSDWDWHVFVQILLPPLRQFMDSLTDRLAQFTRHGHSTPAHCLVFHDHGIHELSQFLSSVNAKRLDLERLSCRRDDRLYARPCGFGEQSCLHSAVAHVDG